MQPSTAQREIWNLQHDSAKVQLSKGMIVPNRPRKPHLQIATIDLHEEASRGSAPAPARPLMQRGLLRWNELTRSEQRILIKLFGGGSLRDNDPSETAELRLDGLVDDNGLTPAGIEFVKAAFE
jgi:hypothetical protein